MVLERGFERLVRVKEAVDILLRRFKDLEMPVEEVPITEAYGRIAACEVRAPIDVPSFTRSAVDGYALRAEETFGASHHNPRRFKLLDQNVLLESSSELPPLTAIKVLTGQPIPPPLNAVAMLEAVERKGDIIEVYEPIPPLKNVSLIGEDIKKGEVLLRRGDIISPQLLGLLASCGFNTISVYRKIKILIVSSGEELAKPGSPIGRYMCYDSSSYVIYGLALKNYCIADIYPKAPIKTSKEDILEALNYGVENYDITIFIGGSSVGSTDIVPYVLTEKGDLLFHGVAMKPGMPAAALEVQGKPVYCLPGPPVAAFFSFIELVKPLIEHIYRLSLPPRPSIRAVLSRKISGEIGKRVYVRVNLKHHGDVIEAEPLTAGGSGILSSLCKAQGYIVLDENVDSLDKGDVVEVHLLEV